MEPEQPEQITLKGPRHTKKGICLVTKYSGWESKIEKINSSWSYSWGHRLQSSQPDGVEFVPMIWGAWSDTISVQKKLDEIETWVEEGKVTSLLGFNEPDSKNQANMSVESAIAYWPHLMEVNIPIGSPGCVHADSNWMKDFMQEVEKRNYRVDFICVHWYGGANPQSLVNYLKKVYELYKIPIWITEFAPADWGAKTIEESKISEEKALIFMKAILPELDKLDFVHRYAWFSANSSNPALGNSALFDSNGNLTALGEYYCNYENEN
ncbi:glycosyl hydrolase [uncultured Draconibacterium sp.]|uniref:glycosyl hydrolase n=1 Tax=uncultured Draconibacterium sp. TaxID=1573823 RepID=UPI0029C0FDBA|nr:glycosyl hydrolase [uncultured Draconibacterium sp.]